MQRNCPTFLRKLARTQATEPASGVPWLSRDLSIPILAVFLLIAASGCQTSGGPGSGNGSRPLLRVAAGAVGTELQLCREACASFSSRTGCRVELVSTPNSASERLALFQQQLAAESPDIDVFLVDVIWPGLLGDFFLDLAPRMGSETLAAFLPRLLSAATIDGRVVALPWFTDAGLLYYRRDLLASYGFSAPPETYEELASMAEVIQNGERAAGRSGFWGFVFQGQAYEGLTCNALEWLVAEGAPAWFDPTGEIAVRGPEVQNALSRMASLVGRLSPPGVTTYQEEDARGLFQSGNAAFMRNWPYAFALGNHPDSPIRGRFAVTRLPRGSAGREHAAVLGGWMLAVSRFSTHPKEACDLVRFLTGAEEQKRRALVGALHPTRTALYDDPALQAAIPFLQELRGVLDQAVARPSRVTRAKYNRASTAFYTAVHRILTGSADAGTALADLDTTLAGIRRRQW